jgi:hypothetical protein
MLLFWVNAASADCAHAPDCHRSNTRAAHKLRNRDLIFYPHSDLLPAPDPHMRAANEIIELLLGGLL